MYSPQVTDSLQSVIQDLRSTLAAAVQDFNDRVDTIATTTEAPTLADDAALYATALGLLRQQELRLTYFPRDLFHEPAWIMLVALFVANHEKRTMNVKALTALAGAPPTTSLRWVDHLHERGLIDRATDPVDRRRVEVSLSDTGLKAMSNYLQVIASR